MCPDPLYLAMYALCSLRLKQFLDREPGVQFIRRMCSFLASFTVFIPTSVLLVTLKETLKISP